MKIPILIAGYNAQRVLREDFRIFPLKEGSSNPGQTLFHCQLSKHGDG